MKYNKCIPHLVGKFTGKEVDIVEYIMGGKKTKKKEIKSISN